MILAITVPICGDAVILTLDPADGISLVLRRPDANFVGPVDPDAVTVYEGSGVRVVDLSARNGQIWFYKSYQFDETTQAFDDNTDVPVTATVAGGYSVVGMDARLFVRDRVDLGIQQELLTQLLLIKPPKGGVIPVRLGPPEFKNDTWPIVGVSVMTDTTKDRALAEFAAVGDQDEVGMFSVSIAVEAWSQNPDERHLMHESLKRILFANLAVFAAVGFQDPDISIQDVNMIDGEMPAPVYCASAALSFTASYGVTRNYDQPLITEIDGGGIGLNNGIPDLGGPC